VVPIGVSLLKIAAKEEAIETKPSHRRFYSRHRDLVTR
jgi:hypothetical protein